MTAPTPEAPAAPVEPDAAPPEAPAAPEAPLHEDPAIAKALEGLTTEQRELLLTTGGKNALNARLQDAKEAKARAAAAETARAELAQTIGKALGLVPDELDPAKLSDQLTAQTSAAKEAQMELAVFRAAQGVADPVALLDSRSFLAKLADIDPTDHLAVAAAVGTALTENPALKTDARRLPAPNPALGSSASGPPDLEAQIAAAQKTGDVTAVIRLQNQKLTNPRQ